MKSFLRVVFAVAVLAISSHADVIYNTFGPDYGLGNGVWAIQQKPVQEYVGVHFTPTYTTQLDQIDLGFFEYAEVNNISISLTSDNGGLPGSALQTWNIQRPLGGPTIETFLSQGDTTLQAGTQYWITVSALDSATAGGWFYNPLNLVDNVAFDLGGGWVNIPANVPVLDVIGTPVPEPGTLCLLGTAGLGLAGLLRRKL